MNNKDLLDKKMYGWLADAMRNEGYYLEVEETCYGMKYKLIKELRVLSEFCIDFSGEMLINGIKVEMNCKKKKEEEK